MTSGELQHTSKRARDEERRRLARVRRLRRYMARLGIAAGLLLIPGLWVFDCSGPRELVDAAVTRTRTWEHVTPERGAHTHTRATLVIEGSNEVVVPRGDTYQRGQRVPVWIHRGRISGWPYFQEVAKPEESEAQEP